MEGVAYIMTNCIYESELCHHGVRGMHWGVRHEKDRVGIGRSRYNVDVSRAKNSQTRKVANDYNKMDDKQFRNKYYVSKKTFAKRYNKSDGDTYNMGRRKAQKIGQNPMLNGLSKIGQAQVNTGLKIRSKVTRKDESLKPDESVKIRDQAASERRAKRVSDTMSRPASSAANKALVLAGAAALGVGLYGFSKNMKSMDSATKAIASSSDAIKKGLKSRGF